MPDIITIQVEGLPRLQAALEGVARDAENLSQTWRAVEDEIYSIEREQFATRGHGSWEPRKDSTVERYTAMNRRGFSVINEPERATDTLFRAVTTRGAPHGILNEEPQSLTMGFDLAYGQYQQTGTTRMPQRKIYDLDEGDARRLAQIIKRGLVTKIADRGFDAKADAGAIPF